MRLLGLGGVVLLRVARRFCLRGRGVLGGFGLSGAGVAVGGAEV